jgi:hypothetical protein
MCAHVCVSACARCAKLIVLTRAGEAVVPLILISSVQGDGLDLLRHFMNLLTPRVRWNAALAQPVLNSPCLVAALTCDDGLRVMCVCACVLYARVHVYSPKWQSMRRTLSRAWARSSAALC